MGFLDHYLKSKAVHPPAEDQAVLIYFANEDLDASIPLQEKLYNQLKDSDLGMFDGNELGGGELVLFLYGSDAELLFKDIEPTLRGDPYCTDARVVIRWGGIEAPRREVVIQRDHISKEQ